ncbi:hypothetical protein HTZ77_15655 [Nonomuraea sp. SMC257]|uniref:Uncharacterized protein n=1 Tax=Nonomuraea montanisoli TaxID=2741721 RepID=A0A7Y6I9I5_9ACTN|nr:hypothetical protein [Nonomuraea montanisoli]NUW32859.1 hypothetical protein [Nonomuraea montanisoli]
MGDRLDDLERRIDELRAGVRRAMRARDTATARGLRADLRAAERAWDALVTGGLDPALPNDARAVPPPGDVRAVFPHDNARAVSPPEGPGRLAIPGEALGGVPVGGAPSSTAAAGGAAGRQPGAGGRRGGGGLRLVTVREQAHQALTLLGVPAQPRLIAAVREAFLGGGLRGAQLTSLRRDEERSFASSPYGRPYYLCAALTDRLSPARGLLAVSTWPQELRMVGPLSPRVHFLTCAVAVAERMAGGHGVDAEPDSGAARLLARMARNIPGGAVLDIGPPDPARVIEAARAELAVHAERDTRDRADLARRAAAQLGDRGRLFGAATLSTIGDRAATGPPAT